MIPQPERVVKKARVTGASDRGLSFVDETPREWCETCGRPLNERDAYGYQSELWASKAIRYREALERIREWTDHDDDGPIYAIADDALTGGEA